MNKFKPVFLGLALVFFSMACVITVPLPGVNPPAATAAETPTPPASPTPTIEPSGTPFPTPTRRATSTDLPTTPPSATVFVQPSLTVDVFSEKVEGGAPTATQTSRPLAIWSPTPASLKCRVETLAPAFGEDFKPRTDFITIWRLYNEGTAPWASGEFLFEYISGDKLHSPGYTPPALSLTIYVKDRVRFDLRMKSPKEPGRYSTTWGLRRSNKKEPFCTFSITIDVVK